MIRTEGQAVRSAVQQNIQRSCWASSRAARRFALARDQIIAMDRKRRFRFVPHAADEVTAVGIDQPGDGVNQAAVQ